MTYQELILTAKPFISLDISVQSTGWFAWDGTKMYYGTYSLMSKDSYNRRLEFSNFIASLYNTYKPTIIYQEDVISGCNFETTRALTELNCVVDNMMIYKIIPITPLVRINNVTWKRIIRLLSQSEYGVKGSGDKEEVRFILNSIGFCEAVAQDIYDALGIALSQIAIPALNLNEETIESNLSSVKKLKEDITKGYELKQYATKEILLSEAEKISSRAKRKRPVVTVDYDPSYKSLQLRFKDLVREVGDDCIFAIIYPINKINNIALTHGFDLSADTIYMLARKR